MYSPACSAEVFPPEGDLIGDELAPAQVVENARVGGEVKAQAVGVERLLRFAIAAVDAADAVFSVAEQGVPISAKLARIWCVRPVSSSTSTRERRSRVSSVS